MTTTELEQVIRGYIQDICKKEYIGKIYIEKLNPVGYSVKLGTNIPEAPITIYGALEDEAFLKFIQEEIRTKRFDLVDYGELVLLGPYDCNPRNTTCKCK